MVRRRVFKISRPTEAGLNKMVAKFKPNKWR